MFLNCKETSIILGNLFEHFVGPSTLNKAKITAIAEGLKSNEKITSLDLSVSGFANLDRWAKF